MPEPDDPRELLIRDALDGYKEEYRELSETWRSHDAKAQGTIAISGIFLAGMLAFVRTLTQTAAHTEKCLLTATAVLLTLSIICCLLVLWIRNVTSAPLGESLAALVKDLLRGEDGIAPEGLLNYCHDQAEMWNRTNQDVEIVNKKKVRHLINAQVLLLLAIGCAGIVTLMEVWN